MAKYGLTPDFISPVEWDRLNKQAEAMSAYAFILQERITANTKTE